MECWRHQRAREATIRQIGQSGSEAKAPFGWVHGWVALDGLITSPAQQQIEMFQTEMSSCRHGNYSASLLVAGSMWISTRSFNRAMAGGNRRHSGFGSAAHLGLATLLC